MGLRIFLADDHQIVRQGLRALLSGETDFELVGEGIDGVDTVRQVEQLRPDVLVLDVMMPRLNGLEVARQIRRRAPATRIVMLSMHSDDAYVYEALQAGAMAYVVKESSAEQLAQAIRLVAAGQNYFSPPINEAEVRSYAERGRRGSSDPYDSLTPREREVLQLTVEGLNGNEVSERLFISPRTVETHRANLMRKLGVRNQKELVRWAMERERLQEQKKTEGLSADGHS
ncbi:MAG: response regulator [Gemmataceae bacterium]